MNDINIVIKNKIALCTKKYLVSSNNNYRLVFDFDDEWAETNFKTVRVIFDGESIDLVMTGNSVALPHIPVCARIFVGVFSDALASTAVEIGCITSVADFEAQSLYEFTESQYDQIVAILNSTEIRSIESISRNSDGLLILYNDGTEDTVTLYDGVSVSQAEVNGNDELVFTLSDGRSINCGNVKGEIGNTPYLSIGTVQTLPSTDEPYVTISGTSEQPVLNFGIPQGASMSAPRVYRAMVSSSNFESIRESILSGYHVLAKNDNSSTPKWYPVSCCKLWGDDRYITFSGDDYEYKVNLDGWTSQKVHALPQITDADEGKALVVNGGELTFSSVQAGFDGLSDSDKQQIVELVLASIPSAEGLSF